MTSYCLIQNEIVDQNRKFWMLIHVSPCPPERTLTNRALNCRWLKIWPHVGVDWLQWYFTLPTCHSTNNNLRMHIPELWDEIFSRNCHELWSTQIGLKCSDGYLMVYLLCVIPTTITHLYTLVAVWWFSAVEWIIIITRNCNGWHSGN